MIDHSMWEAEKNAGVYDDGHGLNPCCYCGHDPCACDDIHDRHRDMEFDD